MRSLSPRTPLTHRFLPPDPPPATAVLPEKFPGSPLFGTMIPVAAWHGASSGSSTVAAPHYCSNGRNASS